MTDKSFWTQTSCRYGVYTDHIAKICVNLCNLCPALARIRTAFEFCQSTSPSLSRRIGTMLRGLSRLRSTASEAVSRRNLRGGHRRKAIPSRAPREGCHPESPEGRPTWPLPLSYGTIARTSRGDSPCAPVSPGSDAHHILFATASLKDI